MRSLRELRIYGYVSDFNFGSIASLPQLERLYSSYLASQERILILTRYLEDKEKFPALKYLGTRTRVLREDVYKEMERVLLDRNIQL